jgi:hypothetical protein
MAALCKGAGVHARGSCGVHVCAGVQGVQAVWCACVRAHASASAPCAIVLEACECVLHMSWRDSSCE